MAYALIYVKYWQLDINGILAARFAVKTRPGYGTLRSALNGERGEVLSYLIITKEDIRI